MMQFFLYFLFPTAVRSDFPLTQKQKDLLTPMVSPQRYPTYEDTPDPPPPPARPPEEACGEGEQCLQARGEGVRAFAPIDRWRCPDQKKYQQSADEG